MYRAIKINTICIEQKKKNKGEFKFNTLIYIIILQNREFHIIQ